MRIEQFVAQSIGEWRSMRSSHSLAFQQFEEIVSHINITRLSKTDKRVLTLANSDSIQLGDFKCPFEISWQADSRWENESNESHEGSCIFIAFDSKPREGQLIRSLGYTEKQVALSNYKFLNDDSIVIQTTYEHSSVEEKIWFLSEKVRCRSSVIRTKDKKGIIQTSFSSELKIKKEPPIVE